MLLCHLLYYYYKCYYSAIVLLYRHLALVAIVTDSHTHISVLSPNAHAPLGGVLSVLKLVDN